MVPCPQVLGKSIMVVGACIRECLPMADRKQREGQADTGLAVSLLPFVKSGPPAYGMELPTGRVCLLIQLILSGSPIIDTHRCASPIPEVILNAVDSEE